MANTGKIRKHNRQRQYLEQIDSLQQQLDTAIALERDASSLVYTIKQVLQSEIETAKDNLTPDDVDSREFGILDGRLEFAEELLAIINHELKHQLIRKGVTNGAR